jgi:hypothetical protein
MNKSAQQGGAGAASKTDFRLTFRAEQVMDCFDRVAVAGGTSINTVIP